MKTAIFVLVLISVLAVSCNTTSKEGNTSTEINTTQEQKITSSKTDVPYAIAERYFVKNDVVDKDLTLKITSKEDFDKYFGMAAVMGDDGKPTSIDFSMQYVLAVIDKKSDLQVTISPLSLTSLDGRIILSYNITTGQKQTYTSRAVLLLIVDNGYSGDIDFEKVI